MFRSFFRDKRGVSEVVASLTMILVVSIAGTALYSYSMTMLSSSGGSFQLETTRKEEQAKERFLMIAVWWDMANQLNISIVNYGKIELAIDAVYIDGTQASTYISGKGETVPIGSIVCVRFTSPISITEDQTYEIIAVTGRGSRDVAYWKA